MTVLKCHFLFLLEWCVERIVSCDKNKTCGNFIALMSHLVLKYIFSVEEKLIFFSTCHFLQV